MITIDDIKSGFLDGALAKLTDYEFNVVVNEGEFLSPVRSGNTVKQFVNGILTMTGADIRALGAWTSGVVKSYIYAFDFVLRFLLPIDDRVFQEYKQGNVSSMYKNVQAFRTALSSTLSGMTAGKITINENGVDTQYMGGIFVDLPLVEDMSLQTRQDIGNSIVYECSFSVALVKNGINTQSITFFLGETEEDEDIVPFMSISVGRTPTLSADLISTRENGSSSAYAESSALKIEFTVPAVSKNPYNTAVLKYIMGKKAANSPVFVRMQIDGVDLGEDINTPIKMIFADAKLQGEGVSNLVYNVVLVNYTPDGEVIQ